MATMLRKFGVFKKSEPKESEARLRLQKELFEYNECVDHGFPHKPSAFAYDPSLNLIAIGTKSGAIRVLGAPGVEFIAELKEEAQITHLFFIPNQGRLISVAENTVLNLWEINVNNNDKSIIEQIASLSLETSKLKSVSVCCLARDSASVYLGTESGNVHSLDVSTFRLTDEVISQDVIMQNAPDDFKVNPGAVESISQQPNENNKFLIGYNRGLIAMWNRAESSVEKIYVDNKETQLESIAWSRDGAEFTSSHSDGSYSVWSAADASAAPKEQSTTPYGPFPCKAINRLQWKSANPDPYIVFSGGMPRASYGDRHTVSVMCGSLHTVFDFSSRVIDFTLLCNGDNDSSAAYDDPHSLLVLAEEEIVCIDLTTEGWPTIRLPYLSSLHSSAITCSYQLSNVPDLLWERIESVGAAQNSGYSKRDWPITGGHVTRETINSKELLLTGHEDGSVRFWDASSTSLKLVYKLSTASVFGADIEAMDSTAEDAEDWPPFKKVGTFDPYSDDPRLGVQKIAFCALSETLVIGGTAGQVLVLNFEREAREQEFNSVGVNIVSDRDSFIWKGHESLTTRQSSYKYPAGFQVVAMMQLLPPAACTALDLHSEFQLVAAGTAHGFGVFDYSQKKEVTTKCTLNPNDLTGTGESAMSRRKSFKKSLRESFRRIRNRRSERRRRAEAQQQQQAAAAAATSEGNAASEGAASADSGAAVGSGDKAGSAAGSAPGSAAASAHGSPAKSGVGASDSGTGTPAVATTPTSETRTIERQVEARSVNDTLASMVRCLYFTDTFLVNAQSHTPTLWAGTNAGSVYVFQITLPSSEQRDTEPVVCQLGKEIQLRHRAPVLSICVIDRNAQPLPSALEVQNERAKAPDMTGNHQVVICSEEQFKIFSLPNLKANNKFKLTALEGSKIRRVSYVDFRSRTDENYNENDLACLTNQGDLQIFTIPNLRRQLKAQCVRKENVNGIVSAVFSCRGEGYYLSSPSTFMRFSLSARSVPAVYCEVNFDKDSRPARPEPESNNENEDKEAPGAEGAAEEISGKGEGDASTADDDGNSAEDQTKQAEGAGDAPADETVKTEENTTDNANDSVATGDITVDSVKVHLNETPDSTQDMSGAVVTSTRTVVTRTIHKEVDSDGKTTITSENTTVETKDGDTTVTKQGSTTVTTPDGSTVVAKGLDLPTGITRVTQEA